MCAKVLYSLGGPARSQFPAFLFSLRCRVLFHAVNDVSWEAMTLCWHDGDPAASRKLMSKFIFTLWRHLALTVAFI